MSVLKGVLAAGAVAAGVAAVLAYKKHKELEDYDYEDLDEDFDDCCEECDEKCEETTPEEDLDKVEEPVEDVDVADEVPADDAEAEGTDAPESTEE